MIEISPKYFTAIEILLTNLIEWDARISWQKKSGCWTRSEKITKKIIKKIKNDLSITKLQIDLKL